MKTSFSDLVAIATAMILSLSCVGAQEITSANFGDDDIEVSNEQEVHLQDLEENFGYELASLLKKIEQLKSEYEQRREQFEIKRLAILTPAQKIELDKRRRERIEKESIRQQEKDIDFLTKLLPILRDMQSIEALEILEGPQRTGEGTIPLPENQDVVYVDKYYFYEDPLVLNADAKITIESILRSYKSFAAYQGGKFCGGFHPDAIIKVRTQEAPISFLVCFGCAEARIIAKDSDFMVELEPHVYSTLKSVFYSCFRKHDTQ